MNIKMKVAIILLFTGISFLSVGQETKLYKVKKSSMEKEIYYTLKANQKVKHGPYELYFNKWLKLAGYYDNNLKDSTWTEYTYQGKKVWEGHYKYDLKNGLWITFFPSGKMETKGAYVNDSRAGIWEFYHKDGELAQKFDFDKNKMVYADTTLTASSNAIRGGKYDGLMYTDTPPVYVDGQQAFFKFLGTRMQYPAQAKELNLSGRVYISIVVDAQGATSDFKVVRGIGAGCDEEALRVLKLTKGNWKPATFNGQNVGTTMVIPIVFKLS
jgi:TonB family protein